MLGGQAAEKNLQLPPSLSLFLEYLRFSELHICLGNVENNR